MSEKTIERFKAKEIAREFFHKNIDNVSTGTEGFPNSPSFIYGFMEGYLFAKQEDRETIEKLTNKIKEVLEADEYSSCGFCRITSAKLSTVLKEIKE